MTQKECLYKFKALRTMVIIYNIVHGLKLKLKFKKKKKTLKL